MTSTQRFVRNSLLLISIEIMAKGLGVVFFVVVARFLGARELGLYAFAMAVANFVVIPARFGFESLVQREVGRNPPLTRAYFRGLGLLKGLISLLVLGLFVAALALLDPGDFMVMALVAGFALVYSFMEFVDSFFRANQRPELELGVRCFFSTSNLLLGLAVLLAGWRLTGVVSSQLLSVSLAAALGVVLLQRMAVRVKESWDWHSLKHHLTAAAPFAGILVALLLSNQVGVIILKPLAGTVEVGYFAAAVRLFDAMTLIAAAVMGAFLPLMSQLYVQTLGGFVRTLHFTIKYLFILVAPLAVVSTILAPRLILFLYRQAFAPSIPALQILGGALFFSFWNYVGETMLIAVNRERRLLKLSWLTAGISVAANFLLVAKFSHLGACWAILVTQGSYSLVLFLVLMRRYLNLTGLLRLLALPALSAALMAGVLFPLRDWQLFWSIPLGLLTYLGALLACGVISRNDLDRLFGLLTTGSKSL
jgi:O-antigen/teichoic acid export membrane protein